MPLTAKGEEILHSMQKEYGAKKGESVFYASRNKGNITGVDSVNDKMRAAFDSIKADSKFNELVEKLEAKGYSKNYATKIAGKVAQEKGK